VSQKNLFRENTGAVSGTVTGEKRREERLSVNIPVEITGIDRAGLSLNEQTFVEDVTEHGCRFGARTRLQCGDIVTVKPLEPGMKILKHEQPQLFEVVWAAYHSKGCTVGTRKVQGEKFATAEFPPPNCPPRPPAK
jgi:hypothetical protein